MNLQSLVGPWEYETLTDAVWAFRSYLYEYGYDDGERVASVKETPDGWTMYIHHPDTKVSGTVEYLRAGDIRFVTDSTPNGCP